MIDVDAGLLYLNLFSSTAKALRILEYQLPDWRNSTAIIWLTMGSSSPLTCWCDNFVLKECTVLSLPTVPEKLAKILHVWYSTFKLCYQYGDYRHVNSVPVFPFCLQIATDTAKFSGCHSSAADDYSGPVPFNTVKVERHYSCTAYSSKMDSAVSP
jgi:hypothetical protein